MIVAARTMEALAFDPSASGQRTSLPPMQNDVGIGEIAAISRTDPPPPYPGTQDSISRVIAPSPTNRIPQLTETTSDEVERLRNFLHHCLATDYELKHIPKLSPVDTTHFLRLGQSISDILSIKDWHADPSETEEQLWYFLDRFIFEPARVLNIPKWPVVSMICLFRNTIRNSRLYRGAWDGIHYVHTLAEKLLIDRDVMITAVIPATNPGLRGQLLRARDEMQEEYFASLTDTNTFTLTEKGIVFQKNETCLRPKFRQMFEALPLRSCHTKMSELVGTLKFMNCFTKKRDKYRRTE
ncbi:MAG: hypothetical protein Q9187_009198 [Circinaria calcarea]